MKSTRNLRVASHSRNAYIISKLYPKSPFLLQHRTIDDSLEQSIESSLPNISLETAKPKYKRNFRRINYRGFFRKPRLTDSPVRMYTHEESCSKTPSFTKSHNISFTGFGRSTPRSNHSSALELARKSVNSILSSQQQLEDIHKDSTLSIQEMIELCKARCEDNGIPNWEQHVNRFIDSCLNQCKNGKVTLQNFKMGETMARTLSKIVATNRKISCLEIDKAELGDTGVALIAKGLPKSLSLVHLKVTSNKLSYVGARCIFQALLKNSSVTCLDLSSYPDHNRNRIGPASIPFLNELLKTSHTLTFVNLSGNSIGDTGLAELVNGMINGNKSIISLNLSYNSFSQRSLSEISKLLTEGSESLKELDISGNLFGNTISSCLSKTLHNTKDLKRLYLRECQIVDMHELFTAEDPTGPLTRLWLDDNKFSEKGFSSIKEMLASPKCSITELSLSRCGINNEGIANLSKGLKQRFIITALNLSHNEIHDSGAISLVEVLQNGLDVLKTLNLSYNHIGDAGGKELLKILKYNRTLSSMDLSGNMITDSTASILLRDTAILNGECSINLDSNFVSEKLKTEILRKLQKLQSPKKLFSKCKGPTLIRASVIGKKKPKEKPAKVYNVEAVEQQANLLMKEKQSIDTEYVKLKEDWEKMLKNDKETKKKLIQMNAVAMYRIPVYEKELKEVEKEMDEAQKKYERKKEFIECWKTATEEEAAELTKECILIKGKIESVKLKYIPITSRLQDDLEKEKVRLIKTKQIMNYKEAVLKELKKHALANETAGNFGKGEARVKKTKTRLSKSQQRSARKPE